MYPVHLDAFPLGAGTFVVARRKRRNRDPKIKSAFGAVVVSILAVEPRLRDRRPFSSTVGSVIEERTVGLSFREYLKAP